MTGTERDQNLRRLMAPRQVAFVGGRWALDALERSASFGFEGQMWLVNPRQPETAHGEVFAAIEDLPEGPDAVYLAVPSERTIDAVRRLAAIGTGGCICFAAGFAEKGGEGVALEAELVAAAGDMALVGPNCYGMLDCRTGMHLWSSAVLERLEGPGIGIVSQSGALAEFLAMRRARPRSRSSSASAIRPRSGSRTLPMCSSTTIESMSSVSTSRRFEISLVSAAWRSAPPRGASRWSWSRSVARRRRRR